MFHFLSRRCAHGIVEDVMAAGGEAHHMNALTLDAAGILGTQLEANVLLILKIFALRGSPHVFSFIISKC